MARDELASGLDAGPEMGGNELRRVAGELARSNAELADFAHVAAHDLRSPLGIISGYTQLLGDLETVAADPEAADLVAQIHAGIDRMQALIDDLLAYATIGPGPAAHGSVDLAELAATTCVPLVERAGGGATIDIGALPAVPGDEVQLRQLFDNLTTNALKFVPVERRAHVSISAEPIGGGWCVTVADNGVGIAPEDRGAIFGMFQRLHSEAGVAGTGIGLAICHRVVERHGGRIWVDGNEPVGARVHVWLPAE